MLSHIQIIGLNRYGGLWKNLKKQGGGVPKGSGTAAVGAPAIASAAAEPGPAWDADDLDDQVALGAIGQK